MHLKKTERFQPSQGRRQWDLSVIIFFALIRELARRNLFQFKSCT